LYAHVNVEGTSVLLDAARKTSSCSRFVLASSSSVYGNNTKVPFSETDDVSLPISPYAATKRSCELVAHTFHALYKMPVSCLRFFTVFGPRQRPDLAISIFLEKVAKHEPIPMFGDGSSSRDYTFVDDIVAGVLASYDRIPQFGYRIWNLGGNHPVTLREMIATIGRVVGVEPRISQSPMRPGDVERTFADLSRSGAELGYAPRTTFEEGVRRQWEWARSLR
jgi:UDP-glucuronate 4-epimerase